MSISNKRGARGWIARLGGAALAVWAAVAPAPAVATELVALQPAVRAAHAGAPVLTEIAPGRLRLEIALSEPLEHQVFTLAGPDRLVVDFPDLDWRLREAERAQVATMGGPFGVTGLRIGIFQDARLTEDRARLVLDLAGPATVLRHASVPAVGAKPPRFIIEFAVGRSAGSGAVQPASIRRQTPLNPPAGALAEGPEVAPRIGLAPKPRPIPKVIALDPGHGGKDPGAQHGGVDEKWITLTFANELKRVLERPGFVKVFLTRTRDEFVPLPERVRRARAAGADLFISIHADAIENNPDVSGASVYTLSDRASDTLAAQLARRENAADALAGVAMKDHTDEIRSILVDLAKRRTHQESWRFAEVLIGELKRKVPVLKTRPHRQAGFAVLKTFDTPAVLVELGFMTNILDRRRLENPAWREKAALAMTKAVTRWLRGARPDLRDAASQH